MLCTIMLLKIGKLAQMTEEKSNLNLQPNVILILRLKNAFKCCLKYSYTSNSSLLVCLLKTWPEKYCIVTRTSSGNFCTFNRMYIMGNALSNSMVLDIYFYVKLCNIIILLKNYYIIRIRIVYNNHILSIPNITTLPKESETHLNEINIFK